LALAFPKEDALLYGIQSGCERLGWGNVKLIKTDPTGWSSGLSQDPLMIDLLIIDYRQPKLLPQNALSLLR